jgi:uncharacterized protein YabN with tetrapyrrole methylase and pyrophosphatase domain|tara:strand:- start:16277 stop:16663 length:387 start_codon:yes stop_codon:yes gene_type:complete
MENKDIINTFCILNKTIDKTIEKCKWIQSLNSSTAIYSIKEELKEVIEALKKNDDDNLEEEIGDLLFTVVLFGKISEKEGKVNFQKSINRINEKIIKRSPHVFGDKIANTPKEASDLWNEIKLKDYKN